MIEHDLIMRIVAEQGRSAALNHLEDMTIAGHKKLVEQVTKTICSF
mgnify:CR=1 FL=1